MSGSPSTKRQKIFSRLASRELRTLGVFVGIASGLVAAIDLSPIGRLVETRVELPISFQVREKLGRAPALDPKIKILALDDSSVVQLQNTEISMKQWSALITGISNANPRAVVIDKVFGHMFEESSDVDSFIGSLSTSRRVVVGSFLSRTRVPQRVPLDLSASQFQLRSFLADESIDPNWLRQRPGIFFGPDARLAKHVGIGQINDFDDGYIAPVIRTSDDAIVPHLSLAAFDSLKIHKNGLLVNGVAIPVDSRGLSPINFPALSQLYLRTKTIAPFVKKTSIGATITSITEGDIVLIMPLHYTGNFDVRSTPIGNISGGYYHAALINSALTGNWLSPAGGTRFVSYVGFAILGVLLGLSLRHVFFALTLVLSIGAIGATSVALFSFGDQIFPWFLSGNAFGIAAIATFAHRARSEELKAVRLRGALKGLVSDRHLDLIVNNPESINAKPVEKVISLMFIDIVGFSLLAEEHPPDVIFNHIKKVFASIASRIHQYGGTIDRTLGDGLFAFFGYSLDGQDTPGNQADDAVSCAVAIQNDNIEEIINAAHKGGFVTPLRIGINTASVYVGDIGSEGRVDFTVIGNGVNFAKRLESGCDLNAIMLSPATLDLSSKFRLSTAGMTKRLIQIKHHTEAIEAIEYDPFVGTDKKGMATKAYYKSKEIERKDQRWPVLDKSIFSLETEFGSALLTDFSSRGIAIELDRFLSKGIVFKLFINSKDGFLQKVLDSNSIEFIECEVRWGRPAGKRFLHGISIKNLNDGQLEEFTNGLRHCVGGIRTVKQAS